VTLDSRPSTLDSHGRPFFWLALAVVFAAFFLANHDLLVSKAEAFTGTADEMEQQAAGGNTLRRLAFLSLAGLGVLGFVLPARRRMEWRSPLVLLVLALAGWSVLSAGWSDMPSMTLRRVMVLSCLLLAAFGLVRQLSPREWLHLAWIIPAAGLLIGLGAELSLGTFRPWSADYRFSGTLHPNTQGLSLAAMCFATFCLARDRRSEIGGRRSEVGGSSNGQFVLRPPSSDMRPAGYLVLFAVGLLFLVLTKSRTSVAGVLVGVTLLVTLRTASTWKWSLGLAALWAVSLAAITVSLLNIDVEDQLTQMALMGRKEQAESLTGRMPIWTTLADHVARRPLVGYGYDSFWTADRIDTVSSELQWGVREAHSAYLDTVLSVGLVGGLLLLAVVFVGLRTSSEQYLQSGHPLFGFLFAMLVFSLINACTESGMTMPLFAPFLTAASLLQSATVSAARYAFQPDAVADAASIRTDAGSVRHENGTDAACGLALNETWLRTSP